MVNGEKFRSTSSVVAAWGSYFFLAGITFQTFYTSSLTAGLVTGVVAAGIGVVSYLIMHRPVVYIGDEGIAIVNPLSRHSFNWSEVESIDTKYTMSVTVDGKVIHAWAAQAGGRFHARTLHPSEVTGTALAGSEEIAYGDSPRTDSGAAAHIARIKWKAAREH